MTRPTGYPNKEPKHSTPEHGALWATLHRAADWVTSTELVKASGLHSNTVRVTTRRWADRGWLERVNGDSSRPSTVRLTEHARQHMPAWLAADEWCRS